jgi:hypothetical protein
VLFTWAGVIGKMVAFFSSKLAGKWVDLKLDEKKRAARSFAKLYFAMEELEGITSRLLEELTNLQNGNGRYFEGAWSHISERLDANSWQFLESVRELGDVIKFFDPVLAAELVQLSDYKASFLGAASWHFEKESKSEKALPFRYEEPAEKFLLIDYEKTYQWLETRENLYDVRDVWEWPEDFLVRFHIRDEDFEQRTLSLDDLESVVVFRQMLERHSVALTEGKEQLRGLMIKHFTIEDVLYVTQQLKPLL